MSDVTGAPPGKGFASALSLALIGAVLLPIAENWRRKPKDSFPLSYYPMFCKRRGKCERVTYLVGIDARGTRHPLPYHCAGSGGLNQVRRQIRRLARRDGAAEELCASVAARLARRRDGRYADLVAIHLVTGKYRLADFFAGRQEPEWERVRATWRARGVGP